MRKVKYLILGAGITGLTFSYYLNDNNFLVLDKDKEIGGLLKTVKNDAFIWDYSGHFLHFKNNEFRKEVYKMMKGGFLRIKNKISHIRYKDQLIDYPFQKNIHQLSKEEFIECLYDLFFIKPRERYYNLKDMLLGKFGKGICKKFLFPYNEKLYACELNKLDTDAMGRFLPYVELKEILSNFKNKNNESYNSSFIYPKGGISSFANKFVRDSTKIKLNEKILKLDLDGKMVFTDQDKYEYEFLINTFPLNSFLKLAGINANGLLSANKVLVFNLGFDAGTTVKDHWIYYPERRFCFYRVGFYNNILQQENMSIYVEIGFKEKDWIDINKTKKRVLKDLEKAKVIEGQKLTAEHSIIIDPAYCHISKGSIKYVNRIEKDLQKKNVFLAGRYALWTYCSIEDNILRARRIAGQIDQR